MEASSCRIVEPVLPYPSVDSSGHVTFMLGLTHSTERGAALFERTETATGTRTWWLLRKPDSSIEALASPCADGGPLVLSNTADAFGCVAPLAAQAPPTGSEVRVRATPGSTISEFAIDLSRFGPAAYVLVDLDTEARTIAVFRNDRLLSIGFDGAERRRFATGEGLRVQPDSYQASTNGWLAWDAYRDAEPYRIMWALAGANGAHQVNKGMSLTSASFDPSERFVAVSTATALSLDARRDAVYVLRASDGLEIFRRYLPTYSRTQVVFLGDGLFAYGDGNVHVLRTSL
jgi:hypothetical protein